MPAPRFGIGGTTIRAKIYVAGGYLPEGIGSRPTKSLFVYDPLTRAWAQKAPLPTTSKGFGFLQQAGLLGKLYVCCEDDHLWAYTPGTDSWRALPRPPSGHLYGAMAAVGGKLYYTSGYGPEFSLNPELDVYDPSTRSWTVKSPMPRPTTDQVAVTFHGKFWVAGGSRPDGLGPTGDVQVYDPVTDQWSFAPSLLNPTRYAAAAWAGGKFFVIGGLDVNDIISSTVQALSTNY